MDYLFVLFTSSATSWRILAALVFLLSWVSAIKASSKALLFITTNSEPKTKRKIAVSDLMATEKQVMVVAIDDLEHSLYALEWTLDHFFNSNPPYKLVIINAKPTPSSVFGIIGPGDAEILPILENDLKKIAAATVSKAKEICTNKLVNDVVVEVVEGDARTVICDAVEKYHATILVVGSHGYGIIRRAILGSVSDYCAHHAHCTVMIVKKPKTKY